MLCLRTHEAAELIKTEYGYAQSQCRSVGSPYPGGDVVLIATPSPNLPPPCLLSPLSGGPVHEMSDKVKRKKRERAEKQKKKRMGNNEKNNNNGYAGEEYIKKCSAEVVKEPQQSNKWMDDNDRPGTHPHTHPVSQSVLVGSPGTETLACVRGAEQPMQGIRGQAGWRRMILFSSSFLWISIIIVMNSELPIFFLFFFFFLAKERRSKKRE